MFFRIASDFAVAWTTQTSQQVRANGVSKIRGRMWPHHVSDVDLSLRPLLRRRPMFRIGGPPQFPPSSKLGQPPSSFLVAFSLGCFRSIAQVQTQRTRHMKLKCLNEALRKYWIGLTSFFDIV